MRIRRQPVVTTTIIAKDPEEGTLTELGHARETDCLQLQNVQPSLTSNEIQFGWDIIRNSSASLSHLFLRISLGCNTSLHIA